MNRLITAKPFIAAAVALGAIVAASAAHARSDVIVSIGFNVPHAYVQPAPVYVQPRPVYVQPQPVYHQGHPRYVQRNGAWGDYDRDGVPNRYDRDSRFHDDRVAHRQGGRDMDRDGVPNRYDRAPNNPYRR